MTRNTFLLAVMALFSSPSADSAPLAGGLAGTPEWMGSSVRADRCDECKTGKLCKPHARREAEVLKTLKARLEDPDPETRIEALEEVADLTLGHENAPSKEVALVLARALEDDKLVVRGEAMQLLTSGQHPEVAVQAVVKELEGFKRNIWNLVQWLSDGDRRGSIEDAMDYLDTTVRAASDLPDDRIVKSLGALLAAFPNEMKGQPLALATCRSLLHLGSKDASKAVLMQFQAMKPGKAMHNIHDMLTDFAMDRDAEDFPEFHEGVAKDWDRWMRSQKLPKKLGRWKGPKDEES